MSGEKASPNVESDEKGKEIDVQKELDAQKEIDAQKEVSFFFFFFSSNCSFSLIFSLKKGTRKARVPNTFGKRGGC